MTNETISRVLVFKTNIQNETDVQKIAIAMEAEKNIEKWNVDVHHCEKLPD